MQQQRRGQRVGVTQEEHRGISLPQMTPGSKERLKWMEPEDLTNSIPVSLLCVLIINTGYETDYPHLVFL